MAQRQWRIRPKTRDGVSPYQPVSRECLPFLTTWCLWISRRKPWSTPPADRGPAANESFQSWLDFQISARRDPCKRSHDGSNEYEAGNISTYSKNSALGHDEWTGISEVKFAKASGPTSNMVMQVPLRVKVPFLATQLAFRLWPNTVQSEMRDRWPLTFQKRGL